MAAKSLADRVAALEAKVGDKTIQEQFREQAELIDRLFIYRFDEFDKKWDERLETKLEELETRLETRLTARLEAQLEAKLEPIRTDLGGVKDDLAIIKDVLKVVLQRLP